jgi:hypothetical protein
MIRKHEKEHFWVVVQVQESWKAALPMLAQGPKFPKEAKPLVAAANAAKFLGISGSVGDQIKIDVWVSFATDNAAKTAAAGLKGLWYKHKKQAQSLVQGALVFAPNGMAVLPLVEEAIKSLTFATEGNAAVVSCRVNKATWDKVEAEVIK